jgi:4-hydroxy-tetrahydrodipicolinate reductase
MANSIRVIQYGLGPIGSAVARLVTERGDLQLVGGVDVDPDKVGKEVGEVIGLEQSLGFATDRTLGETLRRTNADIVLHTTNSYFDQFRSQIDEILESGLDIVSTSEELSFPWLDNKEIADQIDALAKKVGKTVLGTGVNPGFLMDSLPINLSAICQQVDHIEVVRVINASERRGPFQKKIGSGMTVDAFKAKMDEGRMGHVGLPESVAMIFDTFGKKLDRYESGVDPVVAEVFTKTDFFEVQPGIVKGLDQVARGFTEDKEFVRLQFIAALDMGDDGDTIKISGKPELEVKLKGTNGDIATVAITVNAIKRVLEAAPGLVTMRDLPIVNAG